MEKLIITLVNHQLWGAILQPVLIEENPTKSMSVLEVVGSRSSFFPNLSPIQQEIVQIAEKYSDKALMRLYSKEKTTADFLKKVTDETITNYIRPCIENYHQQIITLLPQSEVEFYLRETNKIRTLYEEDKIHFSINQAQAVFNFIKDEELGFRYFIQVKWENEIINLKEKSCSELCSDPAIVVVDQKLFVFEDIDAKKLLPFFTKSYISVPAASEKSYIEKFVLNCVKEYEVRSQGFDIYEINPSKKALLSLENDWLQRPVLHLKFEYGDKSYEPSATYKKVALIEEKEDKLAIAYYFRDKEWENKLIKLLLSEGLEKYLDNYFIVKQEYKYVEEISEEEVYGIIDWIREHPDILLNFSLEQDNLQQNYYVGKISLNTQIDTQKDWFDVHCIVYFDDFQIPFSRFYHHILKGIREYLLPNNQIAILPQEWFYRYYEMMLFGKKSGENIRLKKYYYQLIDHIEGINLPSTSYNDLLKDVPQGLNAQLRPYQQKGFSWLVYLYENNFGGCLADDMGLGKTLQTITLLQYIASIQNSETSKKSTNDLGQFFLFEEDNIDVRDEKYPPSLLVVPTSLLHNWQNEIKRFAPKLKVYSYSGIKRIKSKDIGKVFKYYDIIITTYGVLRNDIELLQTCNFQYLILDESQYVKNPASNAYKAVKQVNASHKLVLTGTPIENSLSDLWAQFDIINEGMLGNFSSFKKAYINPIINKKNKEKEEVLLKMIRPFLLRRTKEEVTPELPPLLEDVIYCDMSDEQKSFYNKEKNKIRNSLITNFESKIYSSERNTSFMALQGLTRLRLLANHPILTDKDFSGESGKFEQVIMQFESLKAGNHKVLIFSAFVKHLRLFADYFDKQSWKYTWLTGDTIDREKEIQKFTNQEDVNCFFISLKAGGVGLNLTAADYVFILDPWWNPAAEMQAVARAHRIGQEKNVMVYRFISSETIEEKIVKLQAEKSALAETFIASNKPLQHLSVEEINELLEV